MRHVRRAIACLALMLLASRTASAGGVEADPFAENACVQCHRDQPGRSSQIVDLEWRQSVHYSAKVGCEGCHGGVASVRRDQFSSADEFKRAAHLERNPEFLLMHREGLVAAAPGRSVSYLCGKCHMKIKEHHLGSPHGEFGQPTCIYCHGGGSHRIERATLEIIDPRSRSLGGRCSPCHRAATMEAVARIKKILTETEDRINRSGNQYKYLEAAGYRNLELEGLHHHAAEARSQVRQIFHSFNMRDIAKLTAEVEGVADRTAAAYALVQQLKQTQRHQTAVGAAAVLFLLSFAGLLIYYKNTYIIHGASSAPTSLQPGSPSRLWTMVEEAVDMNYAQSTAADDAQPASFPQLGICLMFVHSGITVICLFLAAVLSRDGGGGGALLGKIGHLLCWPLLTLDPMTRGDHPALFWPFMLVNSALWSFALAAMIYPVRRWLTHGSDSSSPAMPKDEPSTTQGTAVQSESSRCGRSTEFSMHRD